MALSTLFLTLFLALNPLSEEVLAFAPPIFVVRRSCYTSSSKISSSLSPFDDDVGTLSSSAIDNNRKAFLHSMLTAAATAVVTTVTLEPATAASAAAPAASKASSFLGTYSDPINHPGGTRTITFIEGAANGDYQLAQIKGGGGRVIFGDRAIVIDFSPKGGPRDFAGVLESDGSIRFIRDGNRWPRL
ncbi:hypothetical protein ACHAXM_002651 [Skeletonema potamos]